MNTITKTVAAVIAMFVGGIIYMFWRGDSLIMFTWFDVLGIKSQVQTLRMYAEPYSNILPRWFIFSLPQALWLFSGIVGFICIWGKNDVLNKRFWIITFCIIAFGFEFGQYIGLVSGYFDIIDIIFMIMAVKSKKFCKMSLRCVCVSLIFRHLQL